MLHGELASDDRGTSAVPIFEEFEEITAMIIGEGC
jgi:hypothetical protein